MTCGGRSWAGPERRSEILCVLTHGMGSTPPRSVITTFMSHMMTSNDNYDVTHDNQ